jgi:uncharacterized glyoxalase superfamily protein PhnB
MPTNPSNSGSTLIPCLRYRDAPRAIDWLCQVFGFERHLIVPGPNDTIAHAQLSNGRGMIMLGSASNEGEYGRLVVQPADTGGAETQTTYLVVDDADALVGILRAGTIVDRPPGFKRGLFRWRHQACVLLCLVRGGGGGRTIFPAAAWRLGRRERGKRRQCRQRSPQKKLAHIHIDLPSCIPH